MLQGLAIKSRVADSHGYLLHLLGTPRCSLPVFHLQVQGDSRGAQITTLDLSDEDIRRRGNGEMVDMRQVLQ